MSGGMGGMENMGGMGGGMGGPVMSGGQGQGRRPCKFGFDCHKFKQGNCPFLHDTGQGQGPSIGQGGKPYPQPQQPYPQSKIPQTQNHDSITQEFCRNFQIGECNHNKCKWAH